MLTRHHALRATTALSLAVCMALNVNSIALAEPPVVGVNPDAGSVSVKAMTRSLYTSPNGETAGTSAGAKEGPVTATSNVLEPYSEEWLAQQGITYDNPEYHRLYYKNTIVDNTHLTPEQEQAFMTALTNGTLPPQCGDDAVTFAYFADYCVPAVTGAPGATAAPRPSRSQVQTLVKTVIAKMQVPKPTIQVGPDPSVNEWKMAVVGYPLWLWTSEAPTQSTTTTEAGITLTLNATRTAVTFDMGDGSAPLTCATATPYRKPASMDHPEPSPDCGYVYQRPSLPTRSYTVTASAQWTVAWTGAGYSGTLPLQLTAQRPLPVGELQSVRVG